MGVKDDCYLLPFKQHSFDNKLRSKSQNSISNVNVEKVMEDVVYVNFIITEEDQYHSLFQEKKEM